MCAEVGCELLRNSYILFVPTLNRGCRDNIVTADINGKSTRENICMVLLTQIIRRIINSINHWWIKKKKELSSITARILDHFLIKSKFPSCLFSGKHNAKCRLNCSDFHWILSKNPETKECFRRICDKTTAEMPTKIRFRINAFALNRACQILLFLQT